MGLVNAIMKFNLTQQMIMKVKALESQYIFAVEYLKLWLILAIGIFAVSAKAQNFQVAAIGFYNVENLFDTTHSVDILDTEKFLNMEMPYIETFPKASINTEDYKQWGAGELADWLADNKKQAVGKILLEKNDYDFTSEGSLGNDSKVYNSKLENLAKVIAEMGTTVNPDGLAMIGIAEVEHLKCLEDLVKQPALKDRNYKVIHHNSMDFRGIDVGFIYSPKYFKLEKYHVVPLNLVSESGYRTFTRDILWVEGFLNGDKIHVLVNHWPSRSGGEQVTVEKRKAAAQVCKNILDSLP